MVRKSDWRSARQEKRVLRLLEILSAGLCLAGVVCAWGLHFHGTNGWFTLASLALIPLCLGVYLAFPAYFSMVPEKERGNYGVMAPVMHPLLPLILTAFGLLLGGGTFGLAWSWRGFAPAAGVTAAVSAAIVLLLRRFAPECREHWDLAWLAALVIGLMLLLEIPRINHHLAPEPPEQTLVVVQQLKSVRRQGKRCVFHTQAGEEISLPIPGWAYSAMEEGDQVPVFLNRGFFGIPYAWFDNETYTQMLNE